MLHALFENGSVRPQDLESHIKDEIEREGVKVAEMTRKVKQAYHEVVCLF
jgi:transcriptional activator SPT7